MKGIVHMVVFVALLATSCTKDNYIDTGISNGRHEGKNMLEYMEAHPYDWDSTLLLVRHAGADIVRLFEGRDEAHPEITFFGLTNHSIRRYLLTKKIKRVSDLDPAWCRDILLRHVVDGKLYRKDVLEGVVGDYGTHGTGGKDLKTLAGTDLWVYMVVQESGGIEENAAKPIYANFLNNKGSFLVASADIEPDNCVVHALSYTFTLGDEE